MWNFSKLDGYVQDAQQHNVELIYTLGMTPQWASARPNEPCSYGPGAAAEPAKFQDWQDYVRKIATRYKGKIRYYELWNEPNLTYYFTGSVATLIELSKEAYATLKSVDSSIEVLSPSGFKVSWAQQFLSNGGGQYFDTVASHFYTVPNPPEYTIGDMDKMSALLAQFGMSNKPIWNTEIGWYGQTMSDSDAIAYVSRAMIINAEMGMGRFVWYAWDNHGWAKIWLTEKDSKTLTPAGVAFREVENWLMLRTIQCSTSSVQINSANADLWTCTLTGSSGFNGHIVWMTSGSMNFNIPSSWGAVTSRRTDGSSAPLNSTSYEVTTTPVLFDNAAGSS